MIKILNSNVQISTKTANYTLALTDNNSLVDMISGSALTLTIPKDSVTEFPIGSSVAIRQGGAGQVTIAPVDGTVTINSTGGLAIVSQYGIASLLKIAANTWTVMGSVG